MLFRVASEKKKKPGRKGLNPTNGFDRINEHIPARVSKLRKKCAPDLVSVPHVRDVIGRRLLWTDRKRDETLSWTQSVLFPLVLGTCREYKGNDKISLYLIDGDYAERPANRSFPKTEETAQARPTDFHFAPDLMKDLHIIGWAEWHEKWDLPKLQGQWFTHEWLSHHQMETKTGSRRATLPDLIAAGLYQFLPELQTEDADQMRGLYDRCVSVSSLNFSKREASTGISFEDLDKANRLACCFLAAKREKGKLIGPLHIFLSLLGLRHRPEENLKFRRWIRENYTSKHCSTLTRRSRC